MPQNVKVTGRVLTFSESVLRLNPELLSSRAVPASKPQPDQGGALGKRASTGQSSRGRMAKSGPLLRITLISCRRRLVSDKGNLASGFKELQDCIARYFDLDDEDGTIDWEYRQCETRGEQETLIRISTYAP